MEIRVPSVGESVTEALIARWHKADGDPVERDEPLCEIETDKITLEINADTAGTLSIRVPAGEKVDIGSVIGVIEEKEAGKAAPKGARPAPSPPPASSGAGVALPLSPAVRKLAQEKGIRPESIPGSGRGGRVTMDDLFSLLKEEETSGPPGEKRPAPPSGESPLPTEKAAPPPERVAPKPGKETIAPTVEERITRQPMSPIRQRIAERLLAARQSTAMLTTFNEADMSAIMALRAKHREHFRQKHGVDLGIMSFFVKATVEALKEHPLVNARIDGGDIVFQHFYDIGIAIGGEKGLVVPVIRAADRLHLADIEKAIAEFVAKVEGNTLELSDLEGGTFTISNGGVYGSLLSTPILNPPQTGVLGMHAIQERPMARDGVVVIRPMMYLALSYDHRLIDGREAVGFLRRIREYVEDPEEMLLEG